MHLNRSLPANPVFELPLPARVRDPAVAVAADGTYELFFTHYTATIGAAKGRSVTPTAPCDAPGQRRVECTNDHCKWA